MKMRLVAGLACVLILTSCGATAGTLGAAYTDPAHLLKLPFGTYSHWLQPWRAYFETVPAHRFVDGVGLNFNLNSPADPEPFLAMLADQGVRHLRIEVGWGGINDADEGKIDNAEGLRSLLAAARRHGIRPLILLNSNQGKPCPSRSANYTLTADTGVGATVLTLTDSRGLVPGYSGLSNVSQSWEAEILITRIDGNRVELSKPLPKAFARGAVLSVSTLKYRPFSVPGSAEYRATLAGWLRYVDTVGRFVGGIIGGSPTDRGFDLEVWNELTFGSEFLYINHYYAQKPYNYDETGIWTTLTRETAAYVVAHPALFRGVGLSDGFANTVPWPLASKEPPGITAISKHPYPRTTHFPKDNSTMQAVDARFEIQKSAFVPTYTALLTEQAALGLQTETITRDLAPINNDIYGGNHGRFAGSIDGRPVERPVWITEINLAPLEVDPKVSVARALALKAKTTARTLCFYLNKGATRVSLFGIAGGDRGLGLVRDDYLALIQRPEPLYPKDSSSYLTPSLAVMGRLSRHLSEGLDRTLTRTRPLEILSVSDTHDHRQFAGNGTESFPDLFDRDVLAILPFQVNARRFVIPYYVMTRDVTRTLPPEPFTVAIKGFRGNAASVSAYDPIRNQPVPVTVLGRKTDTLTLRLTATDYPYLLTVQEK